MAEGKSIGLREMKEGQKGRILRIGADGELGRRIRDMGLIPVLRWKWWGMLRCVIPSRCVCPA